MQEKLTGTVIEVRSSSKLNKKKQSITIELDKEQKKLLLLLNKKISIELE